MINITNGEIAIINNKSKVAPIFSLEDFLAKYKASAGDGNDTFNPIVQRDLGENYKNNISIKGTFETSFDPNSETDRGGYCYITTRRPSSGTVFVTDGYGVIIRPTSHSGSDTSLETTGTFHLSDPSYIDGIGNYLLMANKTIAFIEKTIDGKSVYYPFSYTAANNKLTITQMPDNISFSNNETVHLSIAEPNIFIVDNDSTFVDNYQGAFFQSRTNTLSYIRGTTYPIYPGTKYYYKITIGDDNNLSLEIGASYAALSSVISTGARTVAADYVDDGKARTSLGIGVIDTGNSVWKFDEVIVSDLGSIYSQAYAEFDVSDLASTIQLVVDGYGIGEHSGSSANGMKAYLWNPATSSWDEVISDSSSSITECISEDIDKATYVEDNTIKVLISTMYPSSVDIPAKLVIDSVKVRSSYNVGVHVGGCVDVYVNDDNLMDATKDITVDSTDLINHVEFNNAVVWIDKIVDTATKITEYLEGRDYRWKHNDDAFANSTKGEEYIIFRDGMGGQNVTIYYKYSPVVSLAQNLIDNSEDKFGGQDIVVFHKNIHYLSVEITHTSLFTDDEIKTLLEKYIESINKEDDAYVFSYNDFRSYLFTNGVSGITKLLVIDEYREKKEIKKRIISSVNETFTINRNEIFKVK